MQMTLDYCYDDFSQYEGIIYKSVSANGITNTKVNIQGNIFYLSKKDEDVLYYHREEYCKIIYGNRSKFIVGYSFAKE